MRRGAWLLLVASLSLGLALPGAAALQLQAYDAARHDRFYLGLDKDFAGDLWDWSGVARRTDSTNHWATMVSPSYFLSATHWHPGAGATLRFFHSNDPTGSFEDHVVASGQSIAGTDLFLGKLATPVSGQVATYAIAQLDSDAAYLSREILIFGLSNTTPSETNQRMGRNEVQFLFSYLVWSFEAVGGLGADEAQTQSGDSGGPSFLIFAGQPALVGTHSVVNGDTFVPDLVADIQAAMIGENLMVLVPECFDGLDNDGDGDVDFPDDPGCDDANDASERSPLLTCDDGLDNDGDGRLDFDPTTFASPGDANNLPAGQGDPGCQSPGFFAEDPPCQNGQDDGDPDPGLDYDAGLSSNGVADPAGADPECVGRPWGLSEDFVCGLGAELILLVPLLHALRRRRRASR